MMTKWLTYLLEANVYLAAAYGAYWLLLRRQTFYSTNRAYLLLSILVSFAMPLVELELPSSEPAAPIVVTQPVLITAGNTNLAAATGATPTILTLNKALETVFVVGAAVLVVSFLLKLCSVLKLIFNHQRQKRSGYTLVLIPNLPSPFSFLGYLFVASEQDLTAAVLRHELVHIRKKHSWDVLLLELMKAICWFNPVVYLLQNSLKALHEYEADFESTSQGIHPDEYVQALIVRAYQVNGLPFANHFSNKQLLKSRIMKLYQNRSCKLARLTYLISLPLCAGMLCASTMAFSKTYGLIKFKLGRQSEIKLTHLPGGDIQPGKKQRLKITSGAMTSVTDKLEIKGGNGKPLIFTAANLTAENIKMLANWGMIVETTNAKATTTSLILPPPPPPIPSVPANAPKQKKLHPVLPPPPPPPSALRNKSAKINIIEIPLTNQPDTIAKTLFSDFFKQVGRTTRYPTIARNNGVSGLVVATFRVNQDRRMSDVKIKKGVSPELDAEATRSIAAFNGTLSVNPGIFSVGIDYVIDHGDGNKTNYHIVDSEKPTAGIITVVTYDDRKK